MLFRSEVSGMKGVAIVHLTAVAAARLTPRIKVAARSVYQPARRSVSCRCWFGAGEEREMGRLLLAAVAVYCAGSPVFEDVRPALLDRPLKTFYRTANAAVSDGRRAIAVIDDARRMPSLQTLTSRWPSAF